MGKWATTSVETIENAAEDTNPEVWVEAAENAKTYDSALGFLLKAKEYDKYKSIKKLRNGDLENKILYKFYPNERYIIYFASMGSILGILMSFYIHSATRYDYPSIADGIGLVAILLGYLGDRFGRFLYVVMFGKSKRKYINKVDGKFAITDK